MVIKLAPHSRAIAQEPHGTQFNVGAPTFMPARETEAIILKTFPLGEADRLVSFFGRSSGRMRGVAAGARRLKNRFGSTLEILSHVQLWYFERETRGVPSLADVLVVATILADLQGEPQVLQAQTQCSKPLQRLRLDYAACDAFLKESAQEIAALRDALG